MRSWFISIALGSAALFGARYGRLTEAALPLRAAEPQVSASFTRAPVLTYSAHAVDERKRLEARRQLYESVDALVQGEEFERARQLLDEDTARYGADLTPEWHDLSQSYRFMADCLEHPSPTLRARAEAFASMSRAVGLKRHIVAACSKPTRPSR